MNQGATDYSAGAEVRIAGTGMAVAHPRHRVMGLDRFAGRRPSSRSLPPILRRVGRIALIFLVGPVSATGRGLVRLVAAGAGRLRRSGLAVVPRSGLAVVPAVPRSGFAVVPRSGLAVVPRSGLAVVPAVPLLASRRRR